MAMVMSCQDNQFTYPQFFPGQDLSSASCTFFSLIIAIKVSKGTKIRNRYNQVPHLSQDTNGKVTNSQ